MEVLKKTTRVADFLSRSETNTIFRGAALRYFLPNFAYCYLFNISLLLENHSIASYDIFYRCSWYYFKGGYLVKKHFPQNPLLCWKPFRGILGLTLGILLYLLRAISSYLMKICTDVFCMTLTVNVPRMFHSMYLSFK